MQLGQLQKIEPELVRLGYQVLGISPDPPKMLAQSVLENGLTYELLSDRNLTAARAFGIAFYRKGDRPLPVPSIFVVGTDGVVRFQYVNPNYRERLDNKVLLEVAKAFQKK